MFKKFLIILLTLNLLFVGILSPFVRTAHAQGAVPPVWFRQSFFDWYPKVYDTNINPVEEIYGERYTAAQVQWIIYGIWAFILNTFLDSQIVACIFSYWNDFPNLGPCIANSSFKQFFEKMRDDLLQGLASNPSHYSQPALAMAFEDRPMSGISYVREKFNIVKEANAQQGFGFSKLEVVRTFWQASRNISYFFLVLATIVMSFLIMFRFKISPQTVITVQSALPRLFLVIILISFSYAIAGFMIDLVYVVIALFASFFAQANQSLSIPFVAEPSGIYYRLMTEGLPFIGGGVIGLIFLYMPIFFIAFLISLLGLLGNLNFTIIMPLLVGLIAIIASIVIFLLLFFIGFKISWMLIKTLFNVLVLVMAAPLYILAGIIVPGAGFGTWLKELASHLAVYTLVGPMFLLSYIFLVWASLASIPNSLKGPIDVVFGLLGLNFTAAPNMWIPPLTFNQTLVTDVLDTNPSGILLCFMSLAILFMIPKLAEIIKGLISGRPFGYGTAIGEALGPVAAAGGFLGGAAVNLGLGKASSYPEYLQKSGVSDASQQMQLAKRMKSIADAITTATGRQRRG